MLYAIDIGYAYFGIITRGDVIIKTTPIAKWMIGKKLSYIEKWVKTKNGNIIHVL